MDGLITLRDPVVVPVDAGNTLDPERAFRIAGLAGFDEAGAALLAAWTLGLPTFDGEGETIRWSIRDVRQLRSMHAEYSMGYWPDDRDDA
jgi:hypothetical protein